jgi:hypothetical protein
LATQNEKPRNLEAIARVILLLFSLMRSFSLPKSLRSDANTSPPAATARRC